MASMTKAALEAELTDLRTRRAAMAGIQSTAFADQSTTFDQDSLDRRIAAIEQQLATLDGRTRTRYAATTKGV